jgi:hypothetical protein
VRVHRLKQPGLYRFPVHLELLAPSDWVPKITAPHEWESPVDMRWCEAQGWALDDILKHTGRSYVRASYYLQVGDAARRLRGGAAALHAALPQGPASSPGPRRPLRPRPSWRGSPQPTPRHPPPAPRQEDRDAKMDEIQEAYGWDEPDTNGRDDDDVTRALAWHEEDIEAAALGF